MKHSYIKVFVLSTLVSTCAWANTTAIDSNKIKHCYHWIKEGNLKYLTKKYNEAVKNNGGFSFDDQGSNNAAGAGIYCAKTPNGSRSYGDRVVRLDLVEDVVLQNDSHRKCHISGDEKQMSECQGKADILIYMSGSGLIPAGDEWYVIKNPAAVESWSTNTDQIKQDLKDNNMASDPVIALMDAERKSLGIKNYFNGNARQTLAKTLEDTEKLKKMSAAAMVAALSNYKKSGKTDIAKEKITRFLGIYTNRLFSDDNISATDIISLHTQFPELNLKAMAQANASKMDAVVALSLNDKMSFLSSSDQVMDLWRTVLTSPKAMAEINANTFSDETAEAFTKLIKRDAAHMAGRIAGKSSERTLILLNMYLKSGDDKVSALAATLVKDLLKDGSGVDIADLYKKINNPNLKKDQIFGATILENALKDKDADPVSIAMALSVVKTDLTDAQKKVIIAKLEAMPLKMSAQPTYHIFENYKNGKISPELLPELSFMPKLVERSLQEQAQGNAATNVYRLLLSEYYGYFNYQARANADLAYAKAEKVFEKIFKSMIKAGRYDYAMAALQNYSVFHFKTSKWQFALITNLADQNNYSGKDEYDSHIDTVVRSLDGDLMNTLISTATDDANALSKVSKTIVTATLAYLKSNEFTKERSAATFLMSQKEKAKWQNFGLSGRYASDVCYLTRIMESRKDVLIAKFAGDASGIEHTLSTINNDFCQGQLNN